MIRVAGLAQSELSLLRDVIARRRPELLDVVDRIGPSPLSEFERASLRRVIVDELCEKLLPGARAQRRDLELADLLLHLGAA